jgi:5-methylcytosine-specific restriction endonuclease McrA
MWYNSSYHSHVESAFLFLSKSRLSVRVPRDCGKHEKQQIGGSLIRGAMFKRCTRCRKQKPITEFYKNKGHKDGLAIYCKECYGELSRASRETDPNFSVKRQEIWKKYKATKYKEIQEKDKKYKQKNIERLRAYGRKWMRENVEKARVATKKWISGNPEKISEYRQSRRARKKKAGGTITAAEIRWLREFYNYTCLRCGRREPEVKLTLDHVIPLVVGGKNTIDNAQLLCKSCNSSKGTKIIDYRQRRNLL